MARCSERHKVLGPDGVGCCSVPMWCMGVPAGFCDRPAYGEQTEDGKSFIYPHYVPGLACPIHGGPAAPPAEDREEESDA